VSNPVPSRPLVGTAVLDDPLVRELLAERLISVFATLDEGAVHAVPMWFASDQRSILLATGSNSHKVRNLEADSRSTFVVHDSRPGFEVCGVSMVGHAEIVRGDEARPLVDRVHRRYVDVSRATTNAIRAFLDSDDVAIRFHPRSAFTWDQRGTEANAALRTTGAALPLVTTDPRA
jgi:Pyridoxamine 5'-phosphate oxidase